MQFTMEDEGRKTAVEYMDLFVAGRRIMVRVQAKNFKFVRGVYLRYERRLLPGCARINWV